ncbi:MAG: RNA-binding protein [Hyphomicrobiales bacterium]
MARHAHDGEPRHGTAAPAAAVDATRAGSALEASRQDGVDARRAKERPERSCIVTRSRLPPAELIRFVLSPEGVVTPDVRRALPGRGVWVTATRARIDEAARGKAFARAFRKEAAMPADLADRVGELLRKDALQAISLANKAGAVTAGFEKVRSALRDAEVLALIEASDGSPDGREKLAATSRADLPRVMDCFTSTELDLALGRAHVIHAALHKAPAGDFALTKCLRFHRFELIEKHASGSAGRRGSASSNRQRNRIEPQDKSLNE